MAVENKDKTKRGCRGCGKMELVEFVFWFQNLFGITVLSLDPLLSCLLHCSRAADDVPTPLWSISQQQGHAS